MVDVSHGLYVLWCQNKQEPIDQISSFYYIEMYRASYQFKIMSLRIKRFYKMDQYIPIEPSHVEKKRGNPKTKRRDENEQRPKKLAQNFQEKGYICYMLHLQATRTQQSQLLKGLLSLSLISFKF